MKKKMIIIPTLLFVFGIIGAICVIVLSDRSNFAKQLKFEYEKGKSGVIVTGFTGEPKAAVIIPDEIDGYPVTEIGYNAFLGCDTLTEITLPKSVISIGDMAFSGCSSLVRIELPDGLTVIGNSAFDGCSSLTQINIPESTMFIGVSAFKNCNLLTQITLPKDVTSIRMDTFFGCSSLTDIFVDPDNAAYCSVDGILYTNDMKNLVVYPSGKTEKVFDIPDEVVSINDWAFQDCSLLTEIKIPESVTSIDIAVFSGCSSLTDIFVDPDNAAYCSVDGVLYTKDMKELVAYPSGKTEKVFDIPEKIVSIKNWAFRDCSLLTEIKIPESVTSIDGNEFSDCSSLTEISVDLNNADYCSVDGVLYTKDMQTLVAYPVGRTDEVFEISDSVTSIGDSAFLSSILLKQIKIPDSVISVGGWAFAGCSTLERIMFPKSVASVGSMVFYGCSSVTEISVDPDNAAYCSVDGVLYTKDMRTIIAYPAGKTDRSFEIPENVTSIEESAFIDCSSLEQITIPDSVTSIGEWTFSGCSSLTQTVIPEKTESIGAWAFLGCNSLKQITIPASVTSIDTAAFSGCSALESVYYTGTQEMWNHIEIYYDNVPLHYAEKIFSSAETQSEFAVSIG